MVELLHQCKGNVIIFLPCALMLLFCFVFLLIFYMLINHLLETKYKKMERAENFLPLKINGNKFFMLKCEYYAQIFIFVI